MKFPSHILLDVSTYSRLNSLETWVIRFKTKTDVNYTAFQAYSNYKAQNFAPSTSNLKLVTRWGVTVSDHSWVSNSITSTRLDPFTARFGSPLWSVFDINFLRKEKIYTKLKYSRCPQYDIVSGGLAALFSGFLGFLICEKFGLELLDSGDFYTFFMYAVFAAFSLRPLLRISNQADNLWHVFTLNSLYTFLRDLIILFSRQPRYYARLFVVQTNFILTPVRLVIFKFQYLSSIYHFFRRLHLFLTNWPKKGYKTFREVK